MAADAFIQCRVSAATKHALQTVAARQQLTESALMKRLIDFAVQGAVTEQVVRSAEVVTRDSRIYVRLRIADHRLLKERAAARQLAPATYVSLLVRAHLNGVAPLPQTELEAFKVSLKDLTITRRYAQAMCQIARETGQMDGINGDAVIGMVKLLTRTHDRFKALLAANLKSWETGHGE